jgi:apolipoprotein N-acyltransferase
MPFPLPQLDRRQACLAAFSGALLALAFPKVGLGPIAWLGLVPLFIALRDLSIKDSLRLGFVAGFVHYLGLVYWVAFTMHTYGHLPWYLSLLILALMAAYLAFYWALFTATLAWLRPKPSLLPLVASTVWVATEYLRSHLFTGFPWGLLGHSQYRALHLIQISDLLGVYGISFLIVLCNATLYVIILYAAEKTWYGSSVTRGLIPKILLIMGSLLLAVWSYGAWRLKAVDHHIAEASRISVAVVQGNIDQSIKWDPAYQIHTTKIYRDLSLSIKPDRPDLVVWPETATPFYYLANPRLTKVVRDCISDSGTYFLIGSPSFARVDTKVAYYNSAYLIGPDGTVAGRYDKVHLVPFGEYVPLKRWLPFLGKIVAEVGDFSAGARGNTLAWNRHRLGIQICYEVIFPALARALVRNQADLLVNITNDAWFGRTGAPEQHFGMAVFRAIENRRSLVRSANTGISGYIDPAGRILATSRLFERRVMIHDVPLLHMTTVYTRWGDVFAIVVLISVLVLGMRQALRSGFKIPFKGH